MDIEISTPDEIYVRVVRREEDGLNGFGLILGASFVFVPQWGKEMNELQSGGEHDGFGGSII